MGVAMVVGRKARKKREESRRKAVIYPDPQHPYPQILEKLSIPGKLWNIIVEKVELHTIPCAFVLVLMQFLYLYIKMHESALKIS